MFLLRAGGFILRQGLFHPACAGVCPPLGVRLTGAKVTRFLLGHKKVSKKSRDCVELRLVRCASNRRLGNFGYACRRRKVRKQSFENSRSLGLCPLAGVEKALFVHKSAAFCAALPIGETARRMARPLRKCAFFWALFCGAAKNVPPTDRSRGKKAPTVGRDFFDTFSPGLFLNPSPLRKG